jgi:ATPase subunit of ABC transporter with duplicated ATPase domains
METLLRLDAVTTGWSYPIAGPLTWQLARGEVLGLQGPNGAGKSTVLGAIAGTARVFSGTIWCPEHCQVALQTQHQPPLQGIPINGFELLALTDTSPSGLPEWLADKLNFRLDKLSGGQRQYLALWAVLNSPADLILLDEPSNNLDVAGCSHLVTAIQSRAQRGAGIIIVSHEAELLAASCDRTITLGGTS